MKMLTPQHTDSRMNIRVSARVPITVDFPPRADNNSLRAVTRDIGFSGAFVENSESASREGTLARVTLETAAGDPVTIDALVVRGRDDGMGLMFADYGEEVFHSLAALLRPELEKRIRAGT